MQNQRLAFFLDAVRALAAFAVVLGHARLSTFGQTRPEGMGFAERVLYQSGSFAHVAVIIFFVISGYLVGGKLYKAGRGGFLPGYALDRASRIYVVALPVLTLSFLSVTVQRWTIGHALTLRSNFCEAGALDLFGTVLFLHDGFAIDNCFDSPVWSLVYEVFYYTFFCAVALAWYRWREPIGKIAAVIAVALGVYGLLEPGLMWALSTIWLLGMALAQPQPLKRPGVVFTAVIAGLFVLQVLLRTDDDVAQEVCATLIVAAALLLLRRTPDRALPRSFATIASGGAAFSYSMYLAHAPAMNLLRTIANHSFGMDLHQVELTPVSVGAWLAFTALGVAAGALFWWSFERHTMWLRHTLERRLGIVRGGRRPEDSAAQTVGSKSAELESDRELSTETGAAKQDHTKPAATREIG